MKLVAQLARLLRLPVPVTPPVERPQVSSFKRRCPPARPENAAAPPVPDFRAEHEQILRDAAWMRRMAGRVPTLPLEERRALIEQTLERLRRVGRQAMAEERLLYPVLARLLGTADVGAATATDHDYIHARMQYLAETDPASTVALQAILYGLEAVITTHVHKEEEILAPLVARLREQRVAQQ